MLKPGWILVPEFELRMYPEQLEQQKVRPIEQVVIILLTLTMHKRKGEIRKWDPQIYHTTLPLCIKFDAPPTSLGPI